MITLIVAHDKNRAIGKAGDIPWQIREDLALFQRETSGGAVIMGKKTWESLPFKPLKNRLNIVVSQDKSLHEHVVSGVEEAIALAVAQGMTRIYGIGGAGIYKAMLPLADRLVITEVDLEAEAPDTYFPPYDLTEWREINRQPLAGAEPKCQVVEYLRK